MITTEFPLRFFLAASAHQAQGDGVAGGGVADAPGVALPELGEELILLGIRLHIPAGDQLIKDPVGVLLAARLPHAQGLVIA